MASEPPPPFEAFLREHSAVVREQAAGERAELPLPVPEALQTVVVRLPGYAPPAYRDVCRLASGTRTLHPALFAGLDAAALAEVATVLDFYALPLAWSGWVAQEAAARNGEGEAEVPFTAPGGVLAPIVAAALAALRADLCAYADSVKTDAALWRVVARVSLTAAARTNTEYAVQVALGYRGPPPNAFMAPVACFVLAVQGDLEGLQAARAAGCPWHADTTWAAASRGHAALLQWAVANGCPWAGATASVAAGAGHLALLQWAVAAGCPSAAEGCAHAAAYAGHTPVLEWLVQQGRRLSFAEGRMAARGGHLSTLQWVVANGGFVDVWATAGAAAGGHLPVLEWLFQRGVEVGPPTCSAAASGGYRDVLQWLRQRECPWDGEACVGAAAGGHLELLQWLVQQGCPVADVLTRSANAAAANGHLEVLQWLVAAHGCPADANSGQRAVEQGHVRVVEWLVDNGWPLYPDAVTHAARTGNLPILQLLRARGAPLVADACNVAARCGHLEVLQFLRADGWSPWDQSDCASAALRHALETGDRAPLNWVLDQSPTPSVAFRRTAWVEPPVLR